MTFNEYQELAIKTAIYPKERGIEYTILGLCSEAGEIAGKYKKIIRDKGGILSQEEKDKLAFELGDQLWYCATLADELGFDLDEIAKHNVQKLKDRKNRGTITGSGDFR